MSMEFTDQNFDQEVIRSEHPALVDFWAPWCGPCLAMSPIIDELAKDMNGGIKVGKLNVDENPQTAQKYGIMSIPAFKIFKNGQVIREFVGMQSIDALRKEINKII